MRTFSYTSGPAYGLLLDAALPGRPRAMRVGDDPAAMLMRALEVEPVADATAAAARAMGARKSGAAEDRPGDYELIQPAER